MSKIKPALKIEVVQNKNLLNINKRFFLNSAKNNNS